MPIRSKFSSQVYHGRIAQGMTQSQVAERLSVSVRWYQRVEKGEKLPGTIVALRLMQLFHFSADDLGEEVGLIVPVSPR